MTDAPSDTSKNDLQFLLDSGLLFEINRRVLHPYGLALSLTESDYSLLRVGDLEGFQMEPSVFEKGLLKFRQFRQEQRDRLAARVKAFGSLVQGDI